MADKQTSLLKLTPEAKVGLFVLLGIILLAYMSLRLGGMQFGRAEGYTISVNFDSAAGLDQTASVRVAGVEVGRVKTIHLKDNKAQVVLEIKRDFKIGKDFAALLTTKGLLGEKYIELIPGSPSAPALQDGGVITHTKSYADMDKLISMLSDISVDFQKVSRSLGNALGGEDGEATIKNIVKNMEELSFRVNNIVAKNDEQLGRIIKNMDQFTTLLSNDGPTISADLRLAIRNLNDTLVTTSKNLNDMISENRGNLKDGVENLKLASLSLQQAMDTVKRVTNEIGPDIKDTVASVGAITKKINRGEGSLGKLVNDDTLHENISKTVSGINKYIEKSESFHTFIGYRGEFLFDARDTKSYFTIRIQPKADKYYLLEIIDDPRGKINEETRQVTTGGVTTTTLETKTSDALKFSAQIAKRFKNVAVRGGIIESTGGVGIDYYAFSDRLKFTLEAFNFGANGNPHMKAGTTVYINKFFFLTAGYDEFASKVGLQSAYAGVGLQFQDEDLKYLFSSAPPISF